MISKEQQDRFKVKLKWQVASKNFRRISRYSYSCFTFKFDIKDQNIMEDFTELVTSDKTALPIEICNFFLNRGLNYTLKYRYIKEAGLKNNWTMFVHVLCLNREKRKVIKKAVGKKWIVRHEFNKKLINGKVRNNFKLEIMNCDKAKVWFIQADSNVWWKPKKIIINSDRAKGTSVGWLIAQIGILQLNKELILKEKYEKEETLSDNSNDRNVKGE